MLNEKVLLDDWFTTGESYEDFEECLKELSDCTNFVKINSFEITVLSFASVKEDTARFYTLNPCFAGAPQEIPKTSVLPLHRVLEKGDHAQLLSETFSKVGVLFFSEGTVFFPARKVMTRGLVQFGAGGPAMDTPTYERDLHISSLFKKGLKRTFVVREFAGVKKLVAILSARYKALPQSALCEIIEALKGVEDFGPMKTHLWMMSNWTSDIYVEFPEKAEEIRMYYELPHDFVPGLWLRTSDTGDSSVKIYPTWRRGHSISYVEKAEVRRVHSGKIDIKKVIKTVVNTAFAEYTKFPDAMCKLMAQGITDASWDLTNPSDKEKNRKKMENVIKMAFKTLNITKAIGKGYEKSLREQLCATFTGSIKYTAYDAATAILSLPERLEGVNPETKHNLESAVAEAPYIKYSADEELPILV